MDTAQLADELLAFAEERVGKDGKYAYTAGYLMGILTEEQWARIGAFVAKDTLL